MLSTRLDRILYAPAARALGRAGRELFGLLMPSTCVVCARSDGTVCRDCEPAMVDELLRPFRAERDAAALPLVEPTQDTDAWTRPAPVVAAARYGGDASRALLAFKDHGRLTVVRYLRPAVHRALAAAPDLLGVSGPLTLVPVPGSVAGFRRRGFDPVEELLGGPLPPGWEVHRGLLAHRRRPPGPSSRARTNHSGTGSTQRRHRNVGRFRATLRGRTLLDRSVVVFDDVMTTGSTVAAAWRALEGVGIQPVGAVVLAAVTAPGTASAEGLNSA